jgi:hypothetical protein
VGAYDENLIALVDQRLRAHQQTTQAQGTCVDRAHTGPGANVLFDGSTVAMPVKVLGTVFMQQNDRCVLTKHGSDWVVTGAWAALGLGEASHSEFGQSPSDTTTSSSYVDCGQIGSFIFTKIYDGTYVRFATSAGCYTTATATTVHFALRLTPTDPLNPYAATDHSTSFIYFNTASQHMSHYGTVRSPDVPHGGYTVQLRWRRGSGSGTLTMDAGDSFHIEVDEGVRQLTPFL